MQDHQQSYCLRNLKSIKSEVNIHIVKKNINNQQQVTKDMP